MAFHRRLSQNSNLGSRKVADSGSRLVLQGHSGKRLVQCSSQPRGREDFLQGLPLLSALSLLPLFFYILHSFSWLDPSLNLEHVLFQNLRSRRRGPFRRGQRRKVDSAVGAKFRDILCGSIHYTRPLRPLKVFISWGESLFYQPLSLAKEKAVGPIHSTYFFRTRKPRKKGILNKGFVCLPHSADRRDTR